MYLRTRDHFNLLKGNQGYSIDVMEVRYQYLTGHCIDGRVLFPATGLLVDHLGKSRRTLRLQWIR